MLSLTIILLLIQSCATDNAIEDIEEETLEEETIESAEQDSTTARRHRNDSKMGKTTQLIVDWNGLLLEIDRYTSGMRPNATARALAYIHLAVYETAVYSMNDYSSNSNRLQGLNINDNRREANIDVNLAINSCYARVIDHFMYNVSIDTDARITTLEDREMRTPSANMPQDIVRNSKRWGDYVAERIIAYSLTDTEAEKQILDPQPFSYEPPIGEGLWTYSDDAERAWFPYWAAVRTFVISPEQTSSVPPPISFSENVTSDYYAQMNEVYEISTTAREEDNEDFWISEFWSDDVEGLMMSPPGRQISIAKQLITQNNLGYEASLALLLRLGFSLNDAAVSTWADKYDYMVMRPNVYIHEFIDADYQTNLYKFIFWPNPSFPGYPSGHSTFASAAAGLFIDQFGDAIDFTDRSHQGRSEFRSTPRQFNSFSDMAEENAFSRVPFGVHIRMDCTEGLRLGYEISDAVNNFNLSAN